MKKNKKQFKNSSLPLTNRTLIHSLRRFPRKAIINPAVQIIGHLTSDGEWQIELKSIEKVSGKSEKVVDKVKDI